MSCSGLVGDFQALARIIQAQANIYELREDYKISVQAMAKMVANYLYNRKMFPLFTNIEVAGIDDKGPRVFTMDAIGSLMEDDYGVSGSSATFALGILEADYTTEITVKDGIELVKKTIRNAIKRDAMTGNGMDILAITKDGIEEINVEIDELGE